MSDAGLPPDQEAVRRLLAEARHDGPPPPEVVARLDETLAALAAERVDGVPRRSGAHEAPDAPVVDLGARRRRLAGVGLLAAAAVVVAGVAIGQGLPGVGGGDDAGSSAGGAADSSTSTQQDDGQSGQDRSAPTDGSAELAPEALKSSGAAAPEADVPAVSSADADLDDQLVALRRGLRAGPTRVELLDGMRALADCGLPDLGPGRRLVAEVDGRPGVVVFRRADGSAQQAEVYVCGTPEPVRTVSLPAR
jgi:hypothetical protein